MKPRNKVEREVMELSQSIPETLEPYELDMFTNAMPNPFTYDDKTRKCKCHSCGHVWQHRQKPKKTSICPHCIRKITLYENFHRNMKMRSTFSCCDHKGDWAILRTFITSKRIRNYKDEYTYSEIERIFFNVKTFKTVYVGRNIFMNNYILTSDMEIKDMKSMSTWNRMIWGMTVSYRRIHPVLKKMGMKKNMDVFNPIYVMRNLHLHPHLETILKMKDGKCKLFLSKLDMEFIDDNWTIIKDVIRHNYSCDKPELWRDIIHIGNTYGILTRERYLTNDAKRTHDEMVAYRRHIDAEELLKKADIYDAVHEAFNGFHIRIPDTNIVIYALTTPKEYIKEGDVMDHCVGTYIRGHKKSLILSARNPDSIATIEVNMQKKEVVQIRGPHNCVPQDYSKILAAVISNMDDIYKIYKSNLQ